MEDFEEKNMFETLHIVSKFLGNWDKKCKSFIQKVFFRVVTNAIRASTGKFCGKSILLPEKLCFLLEIWICSIFFVPCQISYLGEPKPQCTCLEETFVGTLLWKTVFLNFSDFEQRILDFFRKNNGTSVKTVA